MTGRKLPLSEEALKGLAELSAVGLKVGAPRCDGVQRVLHKFYEPLLLLRILEPTQGSSEPDSAEWKEDEGPVLWHTFLNQLCWLCDYEPCGDTTTSIVVQASSNNPTYWVAANTDPSKQAVGRLKWVLAKLAEIKSLSPEDVSAVQHEIETCFTRYGSRKVKNYRYRLYKAIDNATQKGSSDTSESKILQYLEPVRKMRDESKLQELCKFAVRWAHRELLDELCRKHSIPTERSEWSNIRHYLGRLASWYRAAKLLVRFVKKNPEVVESSKVDFVATPPPITPPPADKKTTLKGVIERMLPKNGTKRAASLLEAIESSRVIDFESVFLKLYQAESFKPQCHAEVLNLEHSSPKEFKFYRDDKYIGCSKPSCYCCDLYFKFHPSDIITRQTHGNIWHKWCIPATALREKGRFGWHGKRILKRMTDELRFLALAQIESRLPRLSRIPDSTTGIWSVSTSSGPKFQLDLLSITYEADEIFRDRDDEDSGITERQIHTISDENSSSFASNTSSLSRDHAVDRQNASSEENVDLGRERSESRSGEGTNPVSETEGDSSDSDDEEAVLFTGRRLRF